MRYQLIQGDNRAALKHFPDNHFDSIVTDPPYGIDFLGKAWDANTGALETYQECLRVLKPGGHILAFSAARTYHHLAVTLEQAGFEIRDQIMWIYSSGFPKSQDVGRQIHKRSIGKPDKQRFDTAIMIKVSTDTYRHPDNNKIYRALPDINGDRLEKSHEGEKYGTIYEEVIEVNNAWSGWGTALKPAHEPIALARKPLKSTIKANVVKWGTGALNIDATRIEGLTEKELNWTPQRQQAGDTTEIGTFGASGLVGQEISMFNEKGRFPSNVIGEIPNYQKYFYCPKVSRRERHTGFDLETIPTNPDGMMSRDENGQLVNNYTAKKAAVGNNHPTVKPVELMKYLIKLITPQGGKILDPFNGSGSTGMAAVELGFEYVGIDLDEHYIDIATKRIDAWYKQTNPLEATGLFE